MTENTNKEPSFVQRLMKVQHELKAPKSQYNSFAKYKYRSCEDILEAVKPLNVENGLLLTITDEPIVLDGWHYIKATASVTDGTGAHAVTAYAREPLDKKGQDVSQITGTASSYARKYALNGLYLIDDTKDADTDEHANQSKQAPRQQQSKPQGAGITPKQKQMIAAKTRGLSTKLGIEQLDVYKAAQTKLGIQKSTGDLTANEAGKVIEYLISQEG